MLMPVDLIEGLHEGHISTARSDCLDEVKMGNVILDAQLDGLDVNKPNETRALMGRKGSASCSSILNAACVNSRSFDQPLHDNATLSIIWLMERWPLMSTGVLLESAACLLIF